MTTRFTFKGNASLKDALVDLQDALASKQFGDVLDRMHRRRRENKTSITRNRGAGLMVKDLLVVKIRMQGDRTHGRPHVHIEYGGNYHKASYAIDTGVRLAGGLDSKYDKTVRKWIERNRKNLNRAWRELTSGKNPEKLVARLRTAK